MSSTSRNSPVSTRCMISFICLAVTPVEIPFRLMSSSTTAWAVRLFASLNLWPPAISRTIAAALFQKPSRWAALARVVDTSLVRVVAPPRPRMMADISSEVMPWANPPYSGLFRDNTVFGAAKVFATVDSIASFATVFAISFSTITADFFCKEITTNFNNALYRKLSNNWDQGDVSRE